MRTLDVVIGLGWLAFWLYWLAVAVDVKAGRSQWGRFAGVRLAMAVVLIALLRLHAFRGHTNRVAVLGAVGFAMFALGLGLAIWARIHLGRNWGGPMSQKLEPELVTTGPYRWIRNPIYSGIILAMLGTAVAVGVYWLIPAAVLGGYFVYSAFVEQRFMASQFPDQYPAYKQSTKMLIPFVF